MRENFFISQSSRFGKTATTVDCQFEMPHMFALLQV